MKTLILSLLLFGIIHAQSITLVELFKEHFPDAILNSSISAKNQIELNLKSLLEINPDLLAYQLKAYDAQFTAEIGVDSRVALNALFIKKSNLLTLKNLWVKKQIDAVEKNEPYIYRRQGIIEEMEKSIAHATGKSEIPSADELNENHIKFYSFVALTGSKEKYIDSENYADKLNIYFKNKEAQLNNRFDNINYLNEDELYSFYDESIDYWYLFYEKDQIKYQPYQIMENIYKNKYLSKNSFLVEGLNTAFAEYYLLDLTVQYDYTPNSLLSPRDKIIDNKFSFINLITLFGGYRVPFSKNLLPFSYLDIMAGISFNKIISLDINEGEIIYNQTGSRYGEYHSSKLSYYSSNSIYLSYWIKLQTPIAYSYSTKLGLIAGIYLGYLNFAGDFQILVEEEIKYSQRTDKFVNTVNGTFDQSGFLVAGYAGIKYELTNNLFLAIEGSFPLALNAGLSFVIE